MTRLLRKWTLIAAVALGAWAYQPLTAAEPRLDQLATAEQLRSEAVKALSSGEFERTSELIIRAADLSKDPLITQMSEWVRQYDAQRQQFTAERREQFEKEVGKSKKLIDSRFPAYAIDYAVNAYLLADDKDAFRAEPWVDELVKQTIEFAMEAEKKEQWLKTLRLYSDLSQIEPSIPQWKEALKLATRRIRLLAVYTPEHLREIQDQEIEEREAARELVKDEPATQPTTKPKDEEVINDDFRIDWKDQLKGIEMPMLRMALVESRSNYWREVDYKTLMLGGLRGLQAVATTAGLERTFPAIAQQPKRDQFLAGLGELIDRCAKAQASGDSKLLSLTLDRIADLNAQTIELPEEVLVSEFADGAFAELDAFTSMIWPFDLEEFNKSTQGEFYGVGVQIKLDEDNNLFVVTPIEDSPAYRAKIKAGDVITRINGKNARGITLTQAVKTITGPEGTTVNLTVKSPDGAEREMDIRREKIKVASVKGWQHRLGGGWDYFVDAQQKIAYIRLTNFTKSTGDEIGAAIDDLKKQGARGMILDLRYNPGGLLTAATKVADKFLREGVIVSTKTDPSRDGPVQPPLEAEPSHEDLDPSFPVVVLVNQYSASASEIVSGALKDWHRATIVGERTFGKGSVQMLFPLPTRTAYLKLTTSHYYLPGGRCIHRDENSTTWGVDPDIVVEMTPDQARAAIDARQDQDVLAYDGDAPAVPTTQPKKDLLSSDPQLGAALLLLRLQIANGIAPVAEKS